MTTDQGNTWYGNEVVWLLLPAEGVVRYSTTKIPAYRAVPGKITISARRLDGPTSPIETPDVTAYGDMGFTPTGIEFSAPGCWEITYSLAGRDLRFVLDVRGEPLPTRAP